MSNDCDGSHGNKLQPCGGPGEGCDGNNIYTAIGTAVFVSCYKIRIHLGESVAEHFRTRLRKKQGHNKGVTALNRELS